MISIYSIIIGYTKENKCIDLKYEAIFDHSDEKVHLEIKNCEPCCLTVIAKNLKGKIIWDKYNLDVTKEHEYIPKIRKKSFDFRTRKCCA